MSAQVGIKYKYGKPKANTTATWSGSVDGKSEGAIMKKLIEKHGSGYEIIILDINWK